MVWTFWQAADRQRTGTIMKEMRIGGKQLFWLIATMQAGMTILLTINPALVTAKQDAWLSMVIASVFGVFIAFVSARLSQLYPGKTFVEYVLLIVGKWAGHVLIFLYFLYWYSVLAIILRQYAEFIAATILPRTPMVVTILGMLFVAIYVASAGIEVIARCSEVFGPFILLGIFVPLILSSKGFSWNHILPVYSDTGIKTIIQGSLPTTTFLGDCIILIMLFAFVSKPKSGTKPAMLGVGTAGFLTCVSTFLLVAVIGYGAGAGLTYPFFNLIRYMTYFDFLQNLDSLVVAIWIISVFLKVSLYFFVSTYGTAQWLGVKKWKRLMWGVAPFVLLLAFIPRDFIESSVYFPQKIAIPYLLPVHCVGVPLLLWGIAKLRLRGGSAEGRK
ncbi:GerAB/ArcD/ProY family transporter [Paenibacillus lignilyticus]|uniref:Endospore germination permease n=1 Tax=Paenibacillus lignilyticus TaxID=1172615 RepID=A0ABS5CIW3_9BACL|nr:endospore germination permease [Paenibacillus lignilyticus]MBP3965803.1 endospore germination permease [Paenibacillus lignilyticus]